MPIRFILFSKTKLLADTYKIKKILFPLPIISIKVSKYLKFNI